MSKRIARLLDQPEHLVTKLISTLEDKNTYPSHDARYLAECSQKVRIKLSNLGLDADDTTGEELYQALLVKFEADSKRFEQSFGLSGASYYDKLVKASELSAQYADASTSWALKSSAAKKILRSNPPKKVMKQLHYRSIESLIKRENICEIFIATHVFESKTWHKNTTALISKLDQTDLEPRSVKVLALSPRKWSRNNNQSTVFDRNVAAAALWPSEQAQKTPLLTMVVLLTEALQEANHFKAGINLAKTGGLALWWADMDHLIAELSDQHVSMTLHDTALNAMAQNTFENRVSEHGKLGFWQTLLERYQNLPPSEALFDNSVKEKIAGLKFKPPEPAYEFVEEFDG
jgi:hypothetical protein